MAVRVPRSPAVTAATALLAVFAVVVAALVARAAQTGLFSSDAPAALVVLVLLSPFMVAFAAGAAWHRGGSRGGLVGEVRGLRERQEVGPRKESWTVQSFRLERFDGAGNRLPPVPVELRGLRFSGTLTEGDWVEVDPRRTVGETVRVRHVVDHTTGAAVIGRGPRPGTRVGIALGWLVTIAVLVGIVLFVLAVVVR